jgi:hypothetical protein
VSQRLDATLSRLLLAEGRVERGALEAAVQDQLVHGGALDTLLLELGLLDERALADALARAWGTAPVPLDAASGSLPRPEPEAVAALPQRMAIAMRLCPFRLDDAGLHVLCTSPLDRELLKEVSGMIKADVIPHVVPEVRVIQGLHAAYARPVEERFAALLAHLSPGRLVRSDPPPTIPDAAEDAAVEAVGPTRAPDPDADDITPSSLDLLEALAELNRQDSRDDIVRVALAFARKHLPFAAVFGVRGGRCQGWLRSGAAEGVAFRSQSFAIPEDCTLRKALASPSPSFGKPEITAGNAALFGWLGRRRPRTFLTVPIVVGGRPVAALVGDGGIRARDVQSLAEVVSFGAGLGSAFEALLMRRHQQNPSIFPQAAAATEARAPTPAAVHADSVAAPTNGSRRDGTSPFARDYVPVERAGRGGNVLSLLEALSKPARDRDAPLEPPPLSFADDTGPRASSAPPPATHPPSTDVHPDDEEALWEPVVYDPAHAAALDSPAPRSPPAEEGPPPASQPPAPSSPQKGPARVEPTADEGADGAHTYRITFNGSEATLALAEAPAPSTTPAPARPTDVRQQGVRQPEVRVVALDAVTDFSNAAKISAREAARPITVVTAAMPSMDAPPMGAWVGQRTLESIPLPPPIPPELLAALPPPSALSSRRGPPPVPPETLPPRPAAEITLAEERGPPTDPDGVADPTTEPDGAPISQPAKPVATDGAADLAATKPFGVHAVAGQERFPGPLLVDPLKAPTVVRSAAALGPLVEVLHAQGKHGLDIAQLHLDDHDPRRRYAAVLLFVLTPDARAIDLLRPRLHDQEPRIRQLAADALAPFVAHPRFEAVLTHLRERLAAPLSETRRRAVQLLGAFRDVGAVPLLIGQLERGGDLAEDVRQALQGITLQDHGLRARPWEKWWARARKRSRIDWLLEGLASDEGDIRRAAHAELTAIVGEDFGYRPDQPKKERHVAIAAFQGWWLALRGDGSRERGPTDS